MYCNHCGQEMPDSAKDCPYCKNKIKDWNAPFAIKQEEGLGISVALSVVPVVMLIILMISFIFVAYSRYESNVNAFDWLNDSAKLTGICFHWGVAALFVLTDMECISSFFIRKMDGKVLIANGMFFLLCAIALQVGRAACDDFSDSDMSIILYRIFGTYKSQIGISYLTAILLLVFGVLLQMTNKNKN